MLTIVNDDPLLTIINIFINDNFSFKNYKNHFYKKFKTSGSFLKTIVFFQKRNDRF